jgi:hypothetical protein
VSKWRFTEARHVDRVADRVGRLAEVGYGAALAELPLSIAPIAPELRFALHVIGCEARIAGSRDRAVVGRAPAGLRIERDMPRQPISQIGAGHERFAVGGFGCCDDALTRIVELNHAAE